MSENKLKLINKKDKMHADYISKANMFEGNVLRRHLDNLVQTFGAEYTTKIILHVLKEEIKQATKQSKKAQKAG